MKTRLLTTLSIALVTLMSCSKGDTTILNTPETSLQGKMVDNIVVSQVVAQNNPLIYENYNGKSYEVNNIKGTANYRQVGNDLIVYIKDSSTLQYESTLTLRIPNATASTVNGNRSADEIYYQMSQGLGSGNAAVSFVWQKPLSGSINLTLDPTTNTLKGNMTGLKVSIGNYVPYYFPSSVIKQGNEITPILQASGSFRQFDLSLDNVKLRS